MDWIGVAVNLIGFYIMASNKRTAAYIFLAGNVIWITWAASHQIWSVLFVQCCFVLLNVRMIKTA